MYSDTNNELQKFIRNWFMHLVQWNYCQGWFDLVAINIADCTILHSISFQIFWCEDWLWFMWLFYTTGKTGFLIFWLIAMFRMSTNHVCHRTVDCKCHEPWDPNHLYSSYCANDLRLQSHLSLFSSEFPLLATVIPQPFPFTEFHFLFSLLSVTCKNGKHSI